MKFRNIFLLILAFAVYSCEQVESDQPVIKWEQGSAGSRLSSALGLEHSGQIANKKPSSVGLKVENLLLDLERAEVFATGAVIRMSSGKTFTDNGVHYRGKVNGGIAAVSFYPDGEVYGLAVVNGKPVTITERGISKQSAQRTAPFEFQCQSPDEVVEVGAFKTTSAAPNQCLKQFVEVNYDIFQAKGSQTADYITALMNQSFFLFERDSISMEMSELFIWDQPSPYTGTSCSSLLTQFKANRNNFDGDVAQLLGRAGSCGLASSIGGLANCDNEDIHMAYSMIYMTFNEYPDYSWPVMVVTHEIGHVIGSRHTHACVWNGNNTAIDGCSGFTEGSCPVPGFPPEGGTIMSYCHQRSVGINLTLGFGEQPRGAVWNTIRASCVEDCDGNPPPPPPPPDNKPPVAIITSPDDGEFIPAGQRVEFRATITDPDGNFDHCYLYLNGNRVNLKLTTPNPVLYGSGFRTGSTHTTHFRAYDTDGAEGRSEVVTFHIGDPPPPPEVDIVKIVFDGQFLKFEGEDGSVYYEEPDQMTKE